MDTKKLLICNRHFASHMFGQKQTLYAYALPSNFDRLSPESTSLGCATSDHDSTRSSVNASTPINGIPSSFNNCASQPSSSQCAPQSTPTRNGFNRLNAVHHSTPYVSASSSSGIRASQNASIGLSVPDQNMLLERIPSDQIPSFTNLAPQIVPVGAPAQYGSGICSLQHAAISPTGSDQPTSPECISSNNRTPHHTPTQIIPNRLTAARHSASYASASTSSGIRTPQNSSIESSVPNQNISFARVPSKEIPSFTNLTPQFVPFGAPPPYSNGRRLNAVHHSAPSASAFTSSGICISQNALNERSAEEQYASSEWISLSTNNCTTQSTPIDSPTSRPRVMIRPVFTPSVSSNDLNAGTAQTVEFTQVGRTQMQWQKAHRTTDTGTQTTPKDSVEKLVETRQNQAKEIKRLRETLQRAEAKIANLMVNNEKTITLEQFDDACYTYLKPHTAEFVKAQLSNGHYTNEMKEFSLRLFLKSSSMYEELRKYFRLPTRQTLMNDISRMPCESGLNKVILQAMKANAQQYTDPKKKYCTLALDEMALKKHLQYDKKRDGVVGYTDFNTEAKIVASHSLTLMAQGLFEDWKQPIGYYFVAATCEADNIVDIIRNAVSALIDAGYIPVATISDQGATLHKARDILVESADNPFFVVDDHIIWYLFDIPHLLKNMRNCLLNNCVEADNNTISWNYIRDLYEADKLNHPSRNAPKLTQKHINPINRQKMKVRFAAEVLSATVANQMNRYVSEGILSENARHTADFIKKFDSLFDLFNATLEAHRLKPYRSCFTNSPLQRQLLEDMYAFIGSIAVFNAKGKNITNRFKFLRGWQQNIIAIQQIWARLEKVDSITSLPTKALNQDALENFFGLMRNAGGDNRDPTRYEFMNRFRRTCCVNVLNSSNATNCESSFGYLLLTEIYRTAVINSGK